MTIFAVKPKVLFSVVALASLVTIAEAAPVTTNSKFPNAVNLLELSTASRKPYKAYVKPSSNNINYLNSLCTGNVYQNGNALSFDKYGENSGQCVAFAKAVINAKGTSSWYGTEKVSPNKQLTPYTPIATLVHTCSDGKIQVHYLLFSGNNQNNAGNYYILEQD